jgi:hypothetical protein
MAYTIDKGILEQAMRKQGISPKLRTNDTKSIVTYKKSPTGNVIKWIQKVTK